MLRRQDSISSTYSNFRGPWIFILWAAFISGVLFIGSHYVSFGNKGFSCRAEHIIYSSKLVKADEDQFWQDREPNLSCRPRYPKIIVYNRVPKAGSTTLISILKELAKENDFDFVMPEPYHDHELVKQAILDALISGKKTVICNHFNYPEFLYGKNIAYINILREPVDRCVSSYYYARYGQRKSVWREEHLRRYGNQTLDECMAVPLDELESTCWPCSFSMKSGHQANSMSLMLCGRDGGECEGLDKSVQLQRAWKNIIQDYDAVGITEDLQGSIEILETIFPTFFSGMGAHFASTEPKKVTATVEEYVEPSEDTRNKISQYISADVELYSRVKRRHEQQLGLCRIEHENDSAGR